MGGPMSTMTYQVNPCVGHRLPGPKFLCSTFGLGHSPHLCSLTNGRVRCRNSGRSNLYRVFEIKIHSFMPIRSETLDAVGALSDKAPN